jgi:ketosteroid isomerase-like protein
MLHVLKSGATHHTDLRDLRDGTNLLAAGHNDDMEATDVMRWVAGYEQAWRDRDVDAIERIFTPDASYRRSPYEPADVGHEAIKAFWPESDDTTFTVDATPVAVEGNRAVVRLTVIYLTPNHQEYADLWLLRFADDGRVADFEEWAYWPGKSYTASTADE